MIKFPLAVIDTFLTADCFSCLESRAASTLKKSRTTFQELIDMQLKTGLKISNKVFFV